MQILWRFLLRHTALLDLKRDRNGLCGASPLSHSTYDSRFNISVQKNRPSPGGFRKSQASLD
ncbi:hypothetical protein USDA257_c40610 [Sinorhizobium fredii USDA 257]|uniref:Uncharacterized protein n=1 Tax=Sinorhizobium fredii (strain USDA 257) TaxID=1185652 RepID=I3X9P8_SINF2|nr:hypothetical protein USDA257_c40610 [Sinorhizobium fredii USDA 257]